MNCRLGVKKGVNGKGLAFDPLSKGLVTVFDMQKNAFRMINVKTILSVKCGGEVFKVRNLSECENVKVNGNY